MDAIQRPLATICVVIVVGLVVYGARLLWHSQVECGLLPDKVAQPSGEVSPDLGAAMQAADRVFAEALDALPNAGTGKLQQKDPGDAAPAGRRSGCEWRPGIARSGLELADLFLMGAVSTDSVMRHPLLNMLDVALCPDQEADLRLVVDGYNEAVGPLLSSFRDLRAREVLSLVEVGAIAAWRGEPASDEEVARAALRLEKLGVDAAEARRQSELSRNRMRPPPGNFILHEGRYYLMPNAASLPHSVAYYEKYKFIVLERAQAVVAWFASRGFSVDPDGIVRLYERISSRVIE